MRTVRSELELAKFYRFDPPRTILRSSREAVKTGWASQKSWGRQAGCANCLEVSSRSYRLPWPQVQRLRRCALQKQKLPLSNRNKKASALVIALHTEKMCVLWRNSGCIWWWWCSCLVKWASQYFTSFLFMLLVHPSQVSLVRWVEKFSADTEVLLSERYPTAIILYVQNLAFFSLLQCFLLTAYWGIYFLFSINFIFGEPLAKVE